MWNFSKQKVSILWGGIRGDMIATLFALIVGFLASSLDPFYLKTTLGFDDYLSAIIYFILSLIVGYTLSFLWFALYSFIFGRKVKIELRFDTNPGRKVFGRYLGIFIRNKSMGDLDTCWVALKNVDAVKSKWKPPKAIISGYPLLWGSAFFPREGSKKIGRRKAIIVDVLHTDDRKTGGRIRFTQQHIGELINAPVGIYRVELEMIGSHLGWEFRIPISFTIKFSGGMNIEYVKFPKNVDNHIGEIDFVKDGIIIENYEGIR